MNQLQQTIINKAGLEQHHFEEFKSCLKRVSLKNKEFLLRENSVCKFIGFVESGVLRSYIQKNAEEFNVEFYLSDSFISAYTSFITQTPASGNIQALSDCEVLVISYADYNSLLNSSLEWYKLGKYISDELFMRKCKRQTSLLMDNATERYNLLLETYPKIEQYVSQYHLASYLGIRPESLSRIKSLTYIND
ncbi:MAG: cyclic nucleotide-binding protein [Thalassobius sp.]|nr:cyclic nucleotide-binding protein [Thalassovita sp.]